MRPIHNKYAVMLMRCGACDASSAQLGQLCTLRRSRDGQHSDVRRQRCAQLSGERSCGLRGCGVALRFTHRRQAAVTHSRSSRGWWLAAPQHHDADEQEALGDINISA